VRSTPSSTSGGHRLHLHCKGSGSPTVVYLPSGWTGPPAYEAVVLDHIAEYVDRFSPGVLVEVESPHYMEAAVPERIAQELEKVIAKA
jgi:hypothetical protein